MTTNTVRLDVNGESLIRALDGAFAALDTAGGEVFLDFSGVERIDPGAIRAMEKYSAAAKEKGVRVVLRGVHGGVYKVLKLSKLAARFSFQG